MISFMCLSNNSSYSLIDLILRSRAATGIYLFIYLFLLLTAVCNCNKPSLSLAYFKKIPVRNQIYQEY